MDNASLREEELINKVQEYNILYDIRAAGYRDQSMRNEAWEEIGKYLCLPGAECRDMWKKLRNCYTNAIKRRRSTKTGIPFKKTVKWKWEDQMSFLLPFLESREKQNYLDNYYSPGEYQSSPQNAITDGECESHASFSMPEEDMDEEEDAYGNMAAELEYESERTFVRKNARGNKNAITFGNSWVEDGQPSKASADKADETELFFLSMARSVKRFPVREQARIKMEVCKLVCEAEVKLEQPQSS